MNLNEFTQAGFSVEIQKDAVLHGRLNIEDIATTEDLFMAGTEIIEYEPAENIEFATMQILSPDGTSNIEEFEGEYGIVMDEVAAYIKNMQN